MTIAPPRAVRVKSSAGWLDLAIQGAPGVDGGGTYEFTQTSPASTWVVVHGLNRHPSVTIVDSGGSVIISDVRYDSLTQVTISFGSATSGKAYFN